MKLIWEFISFQAYSEAPDCENDSIYKIHLMKEINWVFKMEGWGESGWGGGKVGAFNPCRNLPVEAEGSGSEERMNYTEE